MKREDVEVVHLQHPEGRVALEQGHVDAWMGLDPFMAATQLEAGSRLIYRNPEFSGFGFLNTHDSFIQNHPDALVRVLRIYEKARVWILNNPEAIAKIVAEDSKQSLAVIKQQLDRADFTKPVPETLHIATLRATAPILVQEQIVRPGTNLDKVIDELVTDTFAKAATSSSSSSK